MQIRFLATYWGHEGKSAKDFLAQILEAGYGGVEINLPPDPAFKLEFQHEISRIKETNPGFVLALQTVLTYAGSFDIDLLLYEQNLTDLLRFEPDFINSQTGRDFYTFAQNSAFIEVAEALTTRTQIPIYHETHRGRFSFHAPTLEPYLDANQSLLLAADLSHFCTVSESMLAGQGALIQKLLARSAHLHARIGHPQGPQVNDPTAPEWADTVTHYLAWWDVWKAAREKAGQPVLTITPEFGPLPYLPVAPREQTPFITPWAANTWMKKTLEDHWNLPIATPNHEKNLHTV